MNEMSSLKSQIGEDILECPIINCRILFLIGQLGPGGAERQLYYLLQSMDRPRYLPVVAVWNYRENDTYIHQIRALGIHVLPIPNASRSITRFFGLIRLVKKLKPEVLHSFSFHTNFPAFCCGLITSSIAIGSVRGDFPQTYYNTGSILGKLCLRYPRVQICNSSIVAKKIRMFWRFLTPKRLCVVRNGMDYSLFKNSLLSVSKPIHILAVGSLLAYKRWDRLIDAAVELKNMKYDFLIRIAGAGPLELSLKQQVQNLEVKDCVEFLGYCPNIPDLLARSSFLAHTSDTEGLPNAIIEAMASGRAVVTTDVGEAPILVEEGNTGFIVKRNDQKKLVERLGLLIKDPALCARMGEAGRVKAEKEFSLNRLVFETIETYRVAGWKEP